MTIEIKKKNDKYWGSIDNINLMLFVAIILDPRYRLKYVKFWFKEWYRKDKGDAMSSKVRDALKMLYIERVGQNRVSSSSGSGTSASLSRDSKPSISNASLSDCTKSYNNRFSNTWQTRTMWKTNLSWIGICWNLLRTLMWKILTS